MQMRLFTADRRITEDRSSVARGAGAYTASHISAFSDDDDLCVADRGSNDHCIDRFGDTVSRSDIYRTGDTNSDRNHDDSGCDDTNDENRYCDATNTDNHDRA